MNNNNNKYVKNHEINKIKVNAATKVLFEFLPRDCDPIFILTEGFLFPLNLSNIIYD